MADRGFDTTLESELSSETPRLDVLVYLDWPGGATYLKAGAGNRDWNSHTWIGVGHLGDIDKIADSADKSDIGIQLTLNYLDDDLRNEAVTNDPVGSDASVYLAALDADGEITTAYEMFTGFIDQVEIVDAGDTGQLLVRLASELSLLSRRRFFTLSDAHQQYLFPGDMGLEFAARMDEPILWGRKSAQLAAPANRWGLPETAEQWYARLNG